jgi:SAM-dependent methyltransferase
MGAPTVDQLASLTDADLRRLRERLETLGYNWQLLSVAPRQLELLARPMACWELRRRGDAAGRVGLLFCYGDSVQATPLKEDLGAELLAALTQAGLLVPAREGALRCPFRLLPVERLLILSDEPSAGVDVVMGVGETTLELASQLPKHCPGPALDVGSGAGTLALLLAARGAAPVIGTDVNPRAATVAQFNARLNGLAAEFRTGDLDQPVAGESFAWVISQPPYVLQPDGTDAVTFLHGGRRGDELAFRLLGRLPALLDADGKALMLFDTPVEDGNPLCNRIRAAVGESAIDVAVLTTPALGVESQVLGYAALEAPELGERYAEAVGRYCAHLAALGVSERSHALVVLRKSGLAEEGGSYTIQLPVKSLFQGGPKALLTLLAALRAATLADELLLKLAVQFQPQATLVEERTGLEEQVARRVTFQTGAFGAEQGVTDGALALLQALQAAPDVAQALQQYAELCEAEPSEVRKTVLDFVRAGLGRGLLIPRS